MSNGIPILIIQMRTCNILHITFHTRLKKTCYPLKCYPGKTLSLRQPYGKSDFNSTLPNLKEALSIGFVFHFRGNLHYKMHVQTGNLKYYS